MVEPMETTPPSVTVDADTIRSQIRALREIHGSANDVAELSPSESEQLLKECALQLQSQIDKALSELSNIGSLAIEDLDACFGRLKEELDNVEAESSKIASNIEDLARTHVEDCTQLESELEELSCSVDSISLKGIEKANTDGLVDFPSHEKVELSTSEGNCSFKILELSDQIEKNQTSLNTLLKLDSILKRLEAVEKFVDALTDLKVIEYEGNNIRLSLRTFIPISNSFSSQHKLEDSFEPLEQNHELLIEVLEGTLELNNVELFPNDVYIGEIIEAAKTFRQLFSSTLMLQTRSWLEWFVRRVQDRIALCTLRRFLVKHAHKSRHSFEYLEKDEIIVAHVVGGINAYIKMPQGWPLSNHLLKLISLKCSDHNSRKISLSFLCMVEEMANSLDAHIRLNIVCFVDAIEEILMQRMRLELQSDGYLEH